ncbi:MAG: AgmX/PglI C-terminal domain-containing protein [Archangium sp.]|nr:AgmX/PglI C-terminal domain-containing protein [Archangium sp.]
MSQALEALAERTWKTQRILMMPLIGLGGVLFLAGLISGFPVLTGLGATFGFAGGFGFWRLRVKAAGFKALLDNPQRVTNVIPIVQTVQGMGITHYPVVIVADDGSTYRLATWTQSVEAALAPFLAKFPHARGLESDSVFSPDDGFGARFKLIGIMLLSIVVGGLVAGLIVLPKTLAHLAQTSVAYEQQVKRNQVEAAALASVSKAELESAWNECNVVDSLEPSLSVWLDGAQAKTWTTKRDGYLSAKYGLKLDSATERVVYRRDFFDAWVSAIMGQQFHYREPERALSIVGVRRGDTLRLRLLDLDDGKTRCEGNASIAKTTPDSAYEENKALADAVMRPFCSKLPSGTCTEVAPEPEPVAAAPVAPPKNAPKGKATPKADPEATSLDRNAILAGVRSVSPRARACYEKALVKQPKLKGTLTVTFVIGANGRVSTASGSGFPDSTVTECVSKAFMTLRFAAPPDRKPVPVKYPLTFQPAG